MDKKTMRVTTAAALGLWMFAGTLFQVGTSLAGGPEGVWRSEDGQTKIHVANCNGKLCGTVVWLHEPIDPQTGKPKTDKLNPDPAKRERPIIGLRVAFGLAPTGENSWTGLVYNADDGQTYKAHLTMVDSRTAKLEGCVLDVLCKAKGWVRVASN